MVIFNTLWKFCDNFICYENINQNKATICTYTELPKKIGLDSVIKTM